LLAFASRSTGFHQRIANLVGVRRLQDVTIKSGFERALHIARLTPAGQRDEKDRFPVLRAESTRELESADIRQSDIEKRDLRRELVHQCDRFLARARRVARIAERAEHHADHHRGVRMVVDNEHTP
jgi:hypothetical protein